MTQLQFGMGAYKRDFAGAPEVQLLNRFPEQLPSNTVEKVSLLSRSGTSFLANFPADTSTGKIRRVYSKLGLFNGDLFVVSGQNFYRYTSEGVIVPIAGVVNNAGFPKFAWDAGIGYQHLFVSDGLLLQCYTGGTHATATLTGTPTPSPYPVVNIAGTYYSWRGNVDYNSPDGSAAHPWLANPGADPMTAFADMVNFIGTPGTDFSTNLRGANSLVTAAANGGPPATSVVVTAISDMSDGNAIGVGVTPSEGLTWSGAFLSGGGTHALEGIWVPTGQAPNAVCTLDHYVMVSMAGTNTMFYILPGATGIGALNFFSKESNPDPIVDLLTFGDTFLVLGSGSIEVWYATGNADAPFSPIEGQTIARGGVDGSLVLVQGNPVFVGSDGIVYAYGQPLTRISTNGIEERIREELRSIAGVT